MFSICTSTYFTGNMIGLTLFTYNLSLHNAKVTYSDAQTKPVLEIPDLRPGTGSSHTRF